MACNILTNKASKDYAMQQLIDFLGLTGTKEKALSEATYFACLKVLSESVGKLPLKLLQHKDNNGVITARGHPLYKVLHDRPNPYMTSTAFWSTIEQNRDHYGNAYALIKGAGSKTSLWILPSEEVEIWYDDNKILSDIPDIYYIYSHGGKLYQFSSEQILHFKTSNTFDGIKGIAVREQLKMTIDGNTKAQKMLNSMYKSGFTAKAVVQYTSDLSDKNLEKFKNKIEKFAGSDLDDEETKNIIPIPIGTTLTPLNIKLADNQFVDVKKYSALQIASAFGIKPNQIGDYEKSSYASAEAQQLSFYVDTLLYIIKQYEEELNYKLLSNEDIENGYYFKFNVAVILRADLKTQVDTLCQAISNFLYTPNEARALLDMESKEGGDQLLGNGASIPVQLAGTQYVNDNGKDGEKEWIKKTIEETLTKLLKTA
nr:MAG TPA: portal protein [Caudoviricetes sp.]